MQFLYPQFLFALLTLGIPIIIHLFNFRRYKKIFFSNVRFLTSVQREHHSRNRLKNLLLLLLRLLALACIIIAFAQPFLPRQNKLVNPGKKYVAIYLDNSFSMRNTAAEGELLEIGKRQAIDIAKSYKEGDAFQLVTNDFELKHQRWYNRNEFIQLIQEVQPGPVFRQMKDITARVQEGFRKAETDNRVAYYISDFQRNMLSGDIKPDSTIHTNIIHLTAVKKANLYIDSVWTDGSLMQLKQNAIMHVRIVNSSDAAVDESTATLTINGKQKAIANFGVAAGGQTEIQMNFSVSDPGQNNGVVTIDDYPVTFDNQFFFSFYVDESLPILVINGSGSDPRLMRALTREPYFKVNEVSEGAIDFSSFDKYDFIILNQPRDVASGVVVAIKDYLDKQGNVLVVPSENPDDIASLNTLLAETGAGQLGMAREYNAGIKEIDIHNPFFQALFEKAPKNIAMPTVKKYYPLERNAASRSVALLQLSNGDPFLAMTPVGKGYIFTFATPPAPEWSNLQEHNLYLPLLYRMSLFRSSSDGLYNIIGRDNYIQVSGIEKDKESVFTLSKDSFEVIPPQTTRGGGLNLYVENLIRDAGIYTLGVSRPGSTAKDNKRSYAFNYNRLESRMDFLTDEELKTSMTSLHPDVMDTGNLGAGYQASIQERGVPLWKWFIVGALVFLLTETLVIRFWR
jgi:hypothetical protein